MGQIDTGVGILESSVFLPNDLADIFDGESAWEWCHFPDSFSIRAIFIACG